MFAKVCYYWVRMRTINISITEEQHKFIDALVDKFGFANRSELFRTIIRRVKFNPEVVEEPKISAKALDRYEKMSEDIKSGRVKTYKANSLREHMERLLGEKRKK